MIRFSAVLVLIIVFVLAYFRFSNPLSILDAYGHRDFTMGRRVLTEFRVVMHYITLLALPLPSRLILDYDFPLSYSLIKPVTTILSIAAIIGMVAFAVYIAKKDKLISFAILWFFGNLVIESSIIPLELVYEHRIYLPSMFVIPLVVFGLIRYVKPRWAHVAIIGLLVVAFSFWTFERNKVWADEELFWKDNVEKSPKKARVHDNYGQALVHKGKYDEAILQYEEAIRLNPKEHISRTNLAYVLIEKGDLDGAARLLNESIKINADYPNAYNNLGVALLRSGRPNEAQSFFSKALALDPNYAEAYSNRGKVLMQMNRFKEAIVDLRRAIFLNPDFYEGYNNLGAAYMQQGGYQEAIAAFTKSLQLKPDSMEAHYNLGIVFLKQGMETDAIREFTQVTALNPDVEPVHLVLADILQKRGDREGAIRHLREALRINPGNLRVRQALEGAGAESLRIN